MQNKSHNLLLICAQTWTSRHVIENALLSYKNLMCGSWFNWVHKQCPRWLTVVVGSIPTQDSDFLHPLPNNQKIISLTDTVSLGHQLPPPPPFFFFPLASNATPDIGSVGRIEKIKKAFKKSQES